MIPNLQKINKNYLFRILGNLFRNEKKETKKIYKEKQGNHQKTQRSRR
jgi:hypothetical protein